MAAQARVARKGVSTTKSRVSQVAASVADSVRRFLSCRSSGDLRITVSMDAHNPQIIPHSYKQAAARRSFKNQCTSSHLTLARSHRRLDWD